MTGDDLMTADDDDDYKDENKASHHQFHNSFIHYEDSYSAPSRLLLRIAPNSATAKEDSFKIAIECTADPEQQVQVWREPIPHWHLALWHCRCCYIEMGAIFILLHLNELTGH